MQKPRDVLTERMQRRVELELVESDAVMFVINAEQGVGPGDRFIAAHLFEARSGAPVICAVNKIDRLRAPEIAAVLADVAELEVVDEVFPISAKQGTGVTPLVERLAELIPEGPFMYPPEDRSDQPSHVHLAELVREQVLKRTREEVPHAVEVAVEEIEERDDGIIDVRAQVWTETESQKGILIGKGGRMIRDIGTAARKELERELGAKVFLELQVRVREHWRRDEDLLNRLGIDWSGKVVLREARLRIERRQGGSKLRRSLVAAAEPARQQPAPGALVAARALAERARQRRPTVPAGRLCGDDHHSSSASPVRNSGVAIANTPMTMKASRQATPRIRVIVASNGIISATPRTKARIAARIRRRSCISGRPAGRRR